MMKRIRIALFALAAFLLAGCNDFLSEPPGSVSVSLEATPTAMPGSADCAISWVTNVDTKHILEYGTATGVYTVATPLSSSESTEHSVTLDSLLPGTTYYYRVRSYYRTYEEVDSEEYSFTTLKGPTSLAFTVVPAATPAQTSASIAFTTNSATASTIEYGTASGVYDSSLVLDSSATAHTRVISGLSTGVTYYYVVHCYSASNGSLASSEYSFTTTTETEPTSAQRARGIWLVGGCSGINCTTAVSAIDLFDPVTATWYLAVATLPTPVCFAAVGTGIYGGHRVIVIAGGFDTSGNALSLVQRYDVDARAWLANGAAMTAARANVVGAVRKNTLYVMGGTTGVAAAGYGTPANTIYAYDIGNNVWATKATVTSGSEKATVAFNDTILFSGGRTGTNSVVATHDGLQVSVDALTGNATELALPANRTGHSVVCYTTESGASVLVLLAGFTSFTGNPACFVLNTTGATGTLVSVNPVMYLRYPFTLPLPSPGWVAGTSLPANVAFGSAVVYEKTLYYFGGTATYLSPSGRNVAYSTQFSDTGAVTNTWNTLDAMPVGRYGLAAVRFE